MEWPQQTEIQKAIPSPAPSPDHITQKETVVAPTPILIDYRYKPIYRWTRTLKTTCYSKYDPGDPGHGRYANDDMTQLPIQERRINRHHYTVALPPELNEFHRALIWLPNKGWRHKYMFHVPEYNGANKDYPFGNISPKIKPYLSVPRDRMKQRGRIDVLFTTAGDFFDIAQRQRHWGAPMKEVECWEIVKIAEYSDGSRKVVE